MAKVLRLFKNNHHDRLIKHRVENFKRDFLEQDSIEYEDLIVILECIEEYLLSCEQSESLLQSTFKIAEAKWWLLNEE